MDNPKLFISYCWSSPSHEELVLRLATELVESGVDVKLDKWDLKEGNDAIAFMEKMVTDTTINKVLIISDKLYAEKADGRAGGVGTETQIISKEVYDNQSQGKFVLVVTEKDEHGNAYVPTYYKSRIHIDLSEVDSYAENFDKLVRWIYDKPLYVKPEMGRKPQFLEEEGKISLGTSAAHRRAISALKEGKQNVAGALTEYLELFSENLEKFRIGQVEGEFDDAVIDSIEQFVPYRDEAIQLFMTIANYAPDEDNVLKLHRFFESLLPYTVEPQGVRSWRNSDFDNFKFIVHELFLYAIAIFIKAEKFDLADRFLSQDYYWNNKSSGNNQTMYHFVVFRNHVESLDNRNRRLKLNKLCLHSDILKHRNMGSGLEFKYLLQADFVLFIRADIDDKKPQWQSNRWWPYTLIYANDSLRPIEIFARSNSKEYFDKVKCLLNVKRPEDLDLLLESYRTGNTKVPSWEFCSFSPYALLGRDYLATKV